MKPIVFLVAGLFLGAVTVIGGYLIFSGYKPGDEIVTISFTEEELQEKIARKFPKEEKVLGIIDIVIDEPDADLLGQDNRIRFHATATVIIPFVGSEKIHATLSSSVRYNPDDYTLRTSDYELESLKTDKLPEKFEPAVRSSITAAARELFDDQVVHTLDEDDFEEQLGRLLIQEIRVKNGRLEVSLGL